MTSVRPERVTQMHSGTWAVCCHDARMKPEVFARQLLHFHILMVNGRHRLGTFWTVGLRFSARRCVGKLSAMTVGSGTLMTVGSSTLGCRRVQCERLRTISPRS